MTRRVRYRIQGQFVSKQAALQALRGYAGRVSISRGPTLAVHLDPVDDLSGTIVYKLNVGGLLSGKDTFQGSFLLPSPELALDMAVAICRVLPAA